MSVNNIHLINNVGLNDRHGYHTTSMSLGHISYEHVHQQPIHYNLQHISPHLQPQPLLHRHSEGLDVTNYLNPVITVLDGSSHVRLNHDTQNFENKSSLKKRKIPSQSLVFEDLIKVKKKKSNVVFLKQLVEDGSGASNTKTPSHFIDLFLDDYLVNLLVDGTNWYINHVPKHRKDKFGPVTPGEIRCVIAILYLSGYVDLPRVRMFWERAPDTSFPLVVNAIPRDRFETIFTSLHAAGSSSLDRKNPLSRISTLVDHLREKFLQFAPSDESHSVDQLRVPYYKQATGLRQFTKTRTMKVWCGCTSSGYCTWFDHIEETHAESLSSHPNIGANKILTYGSKISLCKLNKPTLIFDNIFSNDRVIEELKELKVEAKPVPNRVSLVANKSHNISAVNKEQAKVHNSPMGGIDKLDQNIHLYAITIIGKKWTSHFLLAYILDLTIHNAWQIYRENRQNPLDLLGFRRSIVTSFLTNYGKPSSQGSKMRKKHSKASNVEASSVKSPSYKYKDVRYDGLEHYVIPQAKQTRCFHCKMKTMTRCSKCDVGLHVKCFVSYHSRTSDNISVN